MPNARKLELVRQPEGSAWCLACCVAMICEHTLEAVITECHYQLREVPAPHPLEGLPYLPLQRAVRYLAQYGFGYGAPCSWPQPQTIPEGWDGELSYTVLETIGLLSVRSRKYPDATGWHSVVYCPVRKLILDPQEIGPQKLTGYEMVEWACVPRLSKD
jgi:hypothetical protein